MSQKKLQKVEIVPNGETTTIHITLVLPTWILKDSNLKQFLETFL